jgi:hypothetical protein
MWIASFDEAGALMFLENEKNGILGEKIIPAPPA